MAATSAMIAWTSGDWDDAVSTAEMELVERGSVRGLLGSRDALGFVAFGRGDVGRARTLLGDSLAVGRESGEIALVLPAALGPRGDRAGRRRAGRRRRPLPRGHSRPPRPRRSEGCWSRSS